MGIRDTRFTECLMQIDSSACHRGRMPVKLVCEMISLVWSAA